MAQYFCGEKGCKGHHTFSENCSSIVPLVADYPSLLPFIQGIAEEETQPYEPVTDDTVQKTHGQSTPALKAYRNKMSAITAAVAMAHTAGLEGKAAQVLCLSRTREWMPLWTYELDGDGAVAAKA